MSTPKLGREQKLWSNSISLPLWEIRALDAKPRESATRLELQLPEGIEAVGDWQVPKTARSVSPDGHAVFADRALFTRMIEITQKAAKGEQSIDCAVHYQACNERQCFGTDSSRFKCSTHR